MEGAAPDASRRVLAGQSLGPHEQLPRRAPGERQQQQALGWNPLFEKVRHAAGQRLRLAAARSGDDEQRPLAEGRGATLGRVELGEPGRLGPWSEHTFGL
jgi:hypothetical protein